MIFHEANRVASNRDKRSDGTIGNAEHAARESDHNPGVRGLVHAGDLTEDKPRGIDIDAWVARMVIRRDRRVKYIIHDGMIWRSYDRAATASRPFLPAWTPERYTGVNPHRGHGHVSIWSTVAAETDLSQWGIGSPPPAAPAVLFFEEDDMLMPVTTVVDKQECTVPDCPGGWWEMRANGQVFTAGSKFHDDHHYFGSIHEEWMDEHRTHGARFTTLAPRRGAPGYTCFGFDGNGTVFYEFGPGVGPVPLTLPSPPTE